MVKNIMKNFFKLIIMLSIVSKSFASMLFEQTLSNQSLFEEKELSLYSILSSLYQKKIYPMVNTKTLPLFSTEKQVVNYVLENSVLENEKDLLMVLNNRLKVENNLLTGAQAEQAVMLYNAIFGKTCSQEKLSSPIKMMILRGGRGAGPFTQLLKSLTYNVDESTQPLVSLNVLLGATDDGRSWNQAGKELGYTGIPDIGKSILDMSRDPVLKKLFSFRFSKNEIKKRIRSRRPHLFNKWKGYRYLSTHLPDSTEHLTFIKNAFNESETFRNFMQHPRSYTFTDERDIKFMQAVHELIENDSDIPDISSFLSKAHKEFLFEQEVITQEIENKDFLTELISQLSLSEKLPPEKINVLYQLFYSFNQTMKKVNFQLHEIPLRSIFVLGSFFMHGDWQKSIDYIAELLNVEESNRVLPATVKRLHLIGLLSDGTFFSTEDDINEVKKTSPFEHIYLTTTAPSKEQIQNINNLESLSEKVDFIKNNLQEKNIQANPDALEAIQDVDIIVYMPTTLESNIGSALIVPEIGTAIRNSDAIKVVIPNAIVDNDLKGTQVSDYITRITRYVTGIPLSSRKLLESDYQRSIDYSVGRAEGLLDPVFKKLMKNNFYDVRKHMGICAFGIGNIGKLDEETPENFGMYHEFNIVDLLLTITGVEQAGYKFDQYGNLKKKNETPISTTHKTSIKRSA